MNVLNAYLVSPRSVAMYGMPPIPFALTSDRQIAMVSRAELGSTVGDDEQRSAWYPTGARCRSRSTRSALPRMIWMG